MDRLRSGSGLVKALIAACLLAGVFTMHGLTSNHDATMALTQHSTAATSTTHHAQPQVATAQPLVAMAEAEPLVGMDQAAPMQPVVEVRQADDHGHIHSMEDVCLGMLVALLLALVVALALRSLVTAHPAVLAVAPVRVAADGPSPPWRQPTLSKLCVLRT